MAERRLGTLRHIVFILKTCMLNVANWFVSCSGIFAARTPAGSAFRLRECYGLPTVNRYHGNLPPPRNAPSRPRQPGDRSIIIPNFSIMANSRTTRQFSLSVDRSLPVGRSWRQKASRFEKRGKIRSTGYSVVKVLRRWSCLTPSLYNGHFFAVCPGNHKNFLKFFLSALAMSHTVDFRNPYSSANARMVLSPRRH